MNDQLNTHTIRKGTLSDKTKNNLLIKIFFNILHYSKIPLFHYSKQF